jgi:PTS system D-glucosamine-specific IIC component
MKDEIFGVLQRIGRSFMLPIALLPVAGLFLGIGASLTNITTLETYNLMGVMGPGTIAFAILTVISQAGSIIFENLPILFAMGVAIGMAKKEKAVSALAGAVAFFIMHATISAMISVFGAPDLDGATTVVLGINSLQMGVFGGIIVGMGVAALHNKYYKIELPAVLSFFGGTRFVPIVSAIVYLLVGILMYFIWPFIQMGIYAIGGLVMKSGYVGTWIYGVMERALIPFGLHHVFYLPFWQTAMGGTQMIGGSLIEGAQNIFFAELAQPDIAHFSVSATRFMSGKFPLMIFGLPAAAAAMYRCAKVENRKKVEGLLISAAITSMLTGITEPLEFTFLFVAPGLYMIHCVLAGLSYMLMHIFKVAVGMTFSGGLIDLFLFGILQGNAKTNWVWIIIIGLIYAVVYYFLFSFIIKKFDLKTPGRGDEEEVKLYTRSDYNQKKSGDNNSSVNQVVDALSEAIVMGLGTIENISDLDCCATRLRITVFETSKVDDGILKSTGASGVIHRGSGVQIIYGPKVTVIKSNLEDYIEAVKSGAIIVPTVLKESIKDESRVDSKKESVKELILTSPIKGSTIAIEEINDGVFSEHMLGDGLAFIPSEGIAYAPCDCVIDSITDTKHAINMLSDNGAEILLHIGLDTIHLKGEPFNVLVKEGQKVKRGDILMEFDINAIKSAGYSIYSPLIITNTDDFDEVKVLQNVEVDNNTDVLLIK